MMNKTTLPSNSCCTVPIVQKPIDSKNGVKKKGDFKSTITAVLSGLLASSCCVIPLVVILTGVGGVGFMALARDYQWLTLPFGAAILGSPTTPISKTERAARREAVKSKEHGLI